MHYTTPLNTSPLSSTSSSNTLFSLNGCHKSLENIHALSSVSFGAITFQTTGFTSDYIHNTHAVTFQNSPHNSNRGSEISSVTLQLSQQNTKTTCNSPSLTENKLSKNNIFDPIKNKKRLIYSTPLNMTYKNFLPRANQVGSFSGLPRYENLTETWNRSKAWLSAVGRKYQILK